MIKTRCSWCTKDPIYIEYHDKEWGVPVYDDKKLFEMLVLESFQAGLSWITILKKRENFSLAFDNFDWKKIANYDTKKIESLLQDKGIIRNKLKINATINNAKRFQEVIEEYGSFSTYIWRFVDGKPIVNSFNDSTEVPAQTELSQRIAKDLKKKGFKFFGPITCYAFMEAVGMVNDHTLDCFTRQ